MTIYTHNNLIIVFGNVGKWLDHEAITNLVEAAQGHSRLPALLSSINFYANTLSFFGGELEEKNGYLKDRLLEVIETRDGSTSRFLLRCIKKPLISVLTRPTQELLPKAIKNWHPDLVLELLKYRMGILKQDRDALFKAAAEYGHCESLAKSLKYREVTTKDNYEIEDAVCQETYYLAVQNAVDKGYFGALQILLKNRKIPTLYRGALLNSAVEQGNRKIAQLLLNDGDISEHHYQEAIKKAEKLSLLFAVSLIQKQQHYLIFQ